MYHPNFRVWKLINELPDDAIQSFIIQAELYVRRRYPHAVLMYTTDRKGVVTHVGIYSVKLLLNERHTFKAGLQYAPQLLIDRVPWSDDWDDAYKLRYIDNLWATLAYTIMGEEVSKHQNSETRPN